MFEPFLIPICGFLTFLLALMVFFVFQVLKLKKRLDIFLRKGDRDLESVLKDLVQKCELQEKEIKEIAGKISRLEKISKISFQKLGIIRYNPFKGVGGDQSFSIALLDKQDSGFVITSLYLREGVRIFAKPIRQGKSEYSLSEEEKKAIEKARGF